MSILDGGCSDSLLVAVSFLAPLPDVFFLAILFFFLPPPFFLDVITGELGGVVPPLDELESSSSNANNNSWGKLSLADGVGLPRKTDERCAALLLLLLPLPFLFLLELLEERFFNGLVDRERLARPLPPFGLPGLCI